MPNLIPEEQAFLLVSGVLITGCCHAGIINTVEACRRACPNIAIRTIIGEALTPYMKRLSGVLNTVAEWIAAQKMLEKVGVDKVVATVLPDRMERYFSTSLI